MAGNMCAETIGATEVANVDEVDAANTLGGSTRDPLCGLATRLRRFWCNTSPGCMAATVFQASLETSTRARVWQNIDTGYEDPWNAGKSRQKLFNELNNELVEAFEPQRRIPILSVSTTSFDQLSARFNYIHACLTGHFTPNKHTTLGIDVRHFPAMLLCSAIRTNAVCAGVTCCALSSCESMTSGVASNSSACLTAVATERVGFDYDACK